MSGGREPSSGGGDGRHVSLHRFEGFYWVAKTGGYARAARAFPYPITQPAVHAQVKKLEDELGVTLFERVAKDRMAPTAAGQRLADFVTPFFEALPSVLRSVRSGNFAGELRVASSPLLVRELLPPWVRRFRAARPEGQLHLEEVGEEGVERLRQGAVDVLVDHLFDVPDDVATMTVASFDAVVFAPEEGDPSAAKADGAALPAGLEDVPFVAYAPGLRARDLQFRALADLGLAPPSMLSALNADSILGFVAAGLGWSILPWLAGTHGSGAPAQGVRSAPLSIEGASFDIVCAWRKDTPENPILDAFLEAAQS